MTQPFKPTDTWTGPREIEAARDFVMAELHRMAKAGEAFLHHRAGGDLEVRLATGEIFRFGEVKITRIA